MNDKRDDNIETNEPTGFEIAVIGMAGRFPGARDIKTFWDNLQKGVESITFADDEELRAAGVSDEELNDPAYVKTKGGVLGDVEYFDAPFFDYTPGEAKAMDPQTRLLHQCSWHALEDAGYYPGTYDGSVGLFAGASSHLEWELLYMLSGTGGEIGDFEAHHFVNRDSICTAVSYRLNLKGPAVLVQTACSTSLTAIHTACRSLLSGECDMALAGGVSLSALEKTGYLYHEGMVKSPDGHCRAFDADARGIAGGEGVGMVLLKPLEEAMDDGDHIYAVIKGSAVNNDGSRKIGYTAPSVDGQAGVIRAAMHMAEVPPESITYVETHGTGTVLGDPIEIEALKQAFDTTEKQYCAVGSVKTNVGHLNSAAGVTGFIKAVLALKHRHLPPSLNFKTPNPKIDFQNSPFYVNTQSTEWRNDRYPLRAGVSAFGIGGTNAHVILEAPTAVATPHGQAPTAQRIEPVAPTPHGIERLITLSAADPEALDQLSQNLAGFLEENPVALADLAYTLQTGRKTLPHRKRFVCSTLEEAVEALRPADPSKPSRKVQAFFSKEENRPVIFMLPGLGAQHADMGRDLYDRVPAFKEEMDSCFALLEELSGPDLKAILYPAADDDRDTLEDILISQLVVFAFEYSLARLMIQWGIEPHALIGYSFGEYTAACLSGVLSLRDTLEMLLIRGNLLRKAAPGAMLSVPLPVSEVEPLLDDTLSIAIDNGPSCVVSGPPDAVAAFEKQMKQKRLMCAPMGASRAIHSRMMDPVAGIFRESIRHITFNKPRIPYISNVTGDWITAAQAVDPGYWATHLKETVRFVDGMKKLLEDKNALFLEVGPGSDLKALAMRLIDKNPETRLVNLVKNPGQKMTDTTYLLNRFGQLWLLGKTPDWRAFYGGETRRRIPLPGYPFQKRRYWYEGDPFKKGAEMLRLGGSLSKRSHMGDWFYVPSWKRTVAPPVPSPDGETAAGPVLLFTHPHGPQLIGTTGPIITVTAGGGFTEETARGGSRAGFVIDPAEPEHYLRLLTRLREAGTFPTDIVHLWNIGNAESDHALETSLDLGFYSLLNIAKAVGALAVTDPLRIRVISDGLHEIVGDETVHPVKATLPAALRAISKEYPFIQCRSIDFHRARPEDIAAALSAESAAPASDLVCAYRGRYRWVPAYEPSPLPEAPKQSLRLKERGVYLVTGGTGGIGLTLARHLALGFRAKLVLTGRSLFPPRESWEQWLSTHDTDDAVSGKIKTLLELETAGGEVMVVSADAADLDQMRDVVHRAEQQFGPVNGVIHAAGIVDGAVIQRRTRESTDAVLAPKIRGALVLEQVFQDASLDFVLYCSSLAAMLAGAGQAAYCAANAFLDAHAHHMTAMNRERNKNTMVVSVNWDTWREVGMAPTVAHLHHASFLKHAIEPGEGAEAFLRILETPYPQVLVSTRDMELLARRIEAPDAGDDSAAAADADNGETTAAEAVSRPFLGSEYAEPRNPVEETLARIYQRFFGYDRVGIDDDFFELGGDSLKAMTVAANIHKELDIKIPLDKFFDISTIRGLSEYIAGAAETAGKDKYQSIEPAERREYYPLSSAQKRLFILQQITPESTGYHLPQFLTIEGDLDKDRLSSVFKRLIQRHESFRTSFLVDDENLRQQVHDDVVFEIEHFDLAAKNAKNPGTVDASLSLLSSFIRPFDLSRAPLLRVGLIREEETKHLLVVDMHHIITDGISTDILTREFLLLYAGESPPPLELQYKDFACWQNSPGPQAAITYQLEYWRELFREVPPALNLPADMPRPPVQKFDGASYAFELDEIVTRRLKESAADTDATSFMVLLGVLNVFLAALGGQQDIVVGTPIAGRPRAELEPIIGMFVNTLAVRNFPGPEKSFNRFLGEVKARMLEIFANQEYQFEDLVDSLSIQRDLSRNPLFDILFTFRDLSGDAADPVPSGLTLRPFKSETVAANFDITLNAVDNGDQFYFTMDYCTALFKSATIERFARYFKQIAAVVGEAPNTLIGAVDILPEAEKRQLLFDFNDTGMEYPRDKTAHQLFMEQAARTPEAAALIGRGETDRDIMTYRELDERSDTLAAVLREKGVEPGSIVGIMTGRTLHLITGIMAILKTGAAYLPLDPTYPEERIRYMLEDSDTNIVLSELSRVSEGKEIINLKEKFCRAFPKGGRRPHLLGRAAGGLASAGTPGSLAYVIYTSGSTGKPKGVMIPHRALVNFIEGIAAVIPFGVDDCILSLTTVCFDIFGLETFIPLARGARVVLGNEEEQVTPSLIAAAIEREGVTVFQVTPSRLQLLITDETAAGALGRLNCLLVGGEAFPPALLEKVRPLVTGKIYNMYGPTETTIWSTVKDLTGETPLNIGVPIANTQVYILDSRGDLCPLGAVGELCIGGDGMAHGYVNRPELTADRFSRGAAPHFTSLYRTGDLARWLPAPPAGGTAYAAELECLGRIDNQVKIRGFRIELGEIESQLVKRPDIADAVVTAWEDSGGEKSLSAYVVVSSDTTAPPPIAEIRQYLSRTLPDYMIPSYLMPLDRIPLTPNGKVDRNALPQPVATADETYTAPSGDVEEQLVGIWSELLDVTDIGVNHNFFDMGGNSLKLVRLASILSSRFSREVKVVDLFNLNTIRQLAVHLSEPDAGPGAGEGDEIESFSL